MRRTTGAVAGALIALALGACGTGPSEDSAQDDGASSAPTGATTTAAPTDPAPTAPTPSPPPPPATPELDLTPDLTPETSGRRIAPRTDLVLGGDISWPQCPPGMGIPEKRTLGMPMPVDAAEYVVVGLTNGPGFVANPCLPDQVAWVRERGLLISAYSVASFPDEARVTAHASDGPFDGSTRLGALANTGYQQARFNVTSMLRTGLETPIVWVDVEPVPDFAWSADPVANAAVVRGVARGYREAGYRIGVYSTPLLWEQVVGDLELGVPEWRAAGQTSREEALDRCGDDWVIQGGPAVLGQWVELDRDMNVTCPGVSADLGRWFHSY